MYIINQMYLYIYIYIRQITNTHLTRKLSQVSPFVPLEFQRASNDIPFHCWIYYCSSDQIFWSDPSVNGPSQRPRHIRMTDRKEIEMASRKRMLQLIVWRTNEEEQKQKQKP